MIFLNNLKSYVLLKNFKKSLELHLLKNLKLVEALEEYIYYSKDLNLNKLFKYEILKFNLLNKKINILLDNIFENSEW